MSKQTELVGLSRTTNLDEVNAAYSAGALSNRNLIINGAMQVAQRGTSFGYANGYKLDRWVFDSYSGGSNNCVQDADVPDAKFRNSVKITATADMSDYYFYQKVEGYKHLSGQTVTFSFYAKASQAITGIQIHWEAASTSGGAEQSMTDVETYDLTTSWQRFTFTLTLPAFNTAETASARFGIFNAIRQTYSSPQKGTNIPNGASVWYTGLQLEYGDTATPFEHRSFADELARCQRYYNEFGGVAYAAILTGMQQSTTISSGALTYPTMRAAPAIGFFDLIATDRTAFDYTAIQNGSIAGTKSAYVRFTHPAVGSSRNAILLAVRNGTSGKLTLDAEL